MSARFDVGVYGEKGAPVLSRAWVHGMQWLYDLWKAGGSQASVANPSEVMETYQEPADYLEVLEELEGKALERALSLRELVPRTVASSSGS